MSSSLTVRPARVEDVAQMARVNVRCWQETYRGLMSDAVLDDPGFPAARERFWLVDLLRQGPQVFNAWRIEHPEAVVDLAGATLSGLVLDHVFLSGPAWPGRTCPRRG